MKQNSVGKYLQTASLLVVILCVALFGSGYATEATEITTEISAPQWVDSDSNPEEAVAGYIYQTLGWEKMIPVKKPKPGMRGVTGYTTLSDQEKILYNALKTEIVKVAAGTRESTQFTFAMKDVFLNPGYTAEELGVTSLLDNGQIATDAKKAFGEKYFSSVSKVMNALLVDCPYELYWFDKTKSHGLDAGLSISYQSDGTTGKLFLGQYETATITVDYPVAQAYAVVENNILYLYKFNTARGIEIQSAVDNAHRIVTNNSGLNDYQKLCAYKAAICSLTDYNTAAAANNSTPYGDPWQLIYVFDGDPETKVVCEGYSKAFQYLCDLSQFDANTTKAISVTGTMAGGTGSGGHMWNVVTLGDYKYLADITNSDSGSVGQNGELFLAGYDTYTADTHKYTYKAGSQTITYIYDNDTLTNFAPAELTVNKTPYTTITASGNIPNASNTHYIYWQLYDTGLLSVSGTGAIPDFGSGTAPWYGYRNDIQMIVVEDGITGIGTYAFDSCDKVTNVILPNSLTAIGENAFRGCRILGSVTIPDGVTTIGASAFNQCYYLTTVTIPSTVTTIYGNTFHNCSSFTDIWFGDTREAWNSLNVTGLPNGVTVHCTDDSWDWEIPVGRPDVLILKGAGIVSLASGETAYPWSENIGQIRRVIVEAGIEGLDAGVLAGFNDGLRVDFLGQSQPTVTANTFGTGTMVCRYYVSAETPWSGGGNNVSWIYLPVYSPYTEETGGYVLSYSKEGGETAHWRVRGDDDALHEVTVYQAAEISYRGRSLNLAVMPSDEDLAVLCSDWSLIGEIDFGSGCSGAKTINLSDLSNSCPLIRCISADAKLTINVETGGKVNLAVEGGTVTCNGNVDQLEMAVNAGNAGGTVNITGDVGTLMVLRSSVGNPYQYFGTLNITGDVGGGYVYGNVNVPVKKNSNETVSFGRVAVGTFGEFKPTEAVVKDGGLNIPEIDDAGDWSELYAIAYSHDFEDDYWLVSLRPKDGTQGLSSIDYQKLTNFTINDIIYGNTDLFISNYSGTTPLTIGDSANPELGIQNLGISASEVKVICPVESLESWNGSNDWFKVTIENSVEDLEIDGESNLTCVTLGTGGSIGEGVVYRPLHGKLLFGPVSGPTTGTLDLYSNQKLHVPGHKKGQLISYILPGDSELASLAGLADGESAAMDLNQLAASVTDGEAALFTMQASERIVGVVDMTVTSYTLDSEGDAIRGTELHNLSQPVEITLKATAVTRVVRLHEDGQGTVTAEELTVSSSDNGTISFSSDRFSKYVLLDSPTWNYEYVSGENMLKITGTGAVNITGTAPWLYAGYDIDRVMIDEGITAIGDNVFAGLDDGVRIDFKQTTLPTISTAAFGTAKVFCRYTSNHTSWNSHPEIANVTWAWMPTFNYQGAGTFGPLSYGSDTGWSVETLADSTTHNNLSAETAHEILRYACDDLVLNAVPANLGSVIGNAETDSWVLRIEDGCTGTLRLNGSEAGAIACAVMPREIIMQAQDLTLYVTDARAAGIPKLEVRRGTVYYNGNIQTLLLKETGTSEGASGAVTVSGDIAEFTFYETGINAYKGTLTVTGGIQSGLVVGGTINMNIPGVSSSCPITGVPSQTLENPLTGLSSKAVINTARTPVVDADLAGANPPTIDQFKLRYSLSTTWNSLMLTPLPESGLGSEMTEIIIDNYNPTFLSNLQDNIYWGDNTEISVGMPAGSSPITLTGKNGKGLKELWLTGWSNVTVQCPVNLLNIQPDPMTFGDLNLTVESSIANSYLQPNNCDLNITLKNGGSIGGGRWKQLLREYRNFGAHSAAASGTLVLVKDGALAVMSRSNEETLSAILPSDTTVADAAGKTAMVTLTEGTVNGLGNKTNALGSVGYENGTLSVSTEQIISVFDVTVNEYTVDQTTGEAALGAGVSSLTKEIPVTVSDTSNAESVFVVRLHEENGTVSAARLDTTNSNGGKQFKSNLFSTYLLVRGCAGSHTLSHVNAVNPTFTTDGCREYWACSVCGEKFADAAGTQTITAEELRIPAATPPEALTNLVYNGSDQPLVTAGSVSGGTIEYALGTADAAPAEGWSDAIPSAKNAGDYYVWYRIAGSDHEATPVSVSIGRKDITVSGITAVDKQYDGTAVAELNYSQAVFTGIVGNDELSVTATGTFADEYVGENKAVTITDLTLGGAGAVNYQLAATGQQASTSASIMQGSINLTVTGFDGPYDGQAHSITVTTTESGVTITYSETANGPYSADKPSYINAGRYTIYYQAEKAGSATVPGSGNVIISPKAVTVTAEDQTVNLDGEINTSVSMATLSGALEGHTLSTVTLTAGSTADVTNNGAIVPSAAVIMNGDVNVTANYQITYVNGKLVVTPGDSSVTSAPQAQANLAYTGAAQELITAGTAAGGTMQYALGTDTQTAPTDGWSTDIPTGTDAGTYYVWYKVVGDENHLDTAADKIQAEISRASITPTVSITGWTYGDTANTPSVTGNTGNGTVTYTYAVKGSESFSQTVPPNAGEYTVKASIAETANYTAADVTADFTIAQKSIEGATITLGSTLTYTGAQQTMAISSVTVGSLILTANDYSINDNTGTNAGAYTLTIGGVGNYTGTATQTWSIEPKAVTAPVITLDPALENTYFIYSGQAKEPAVSVQDGETVIPDDEYTVSYSNNTNAGTATVTITDKDGGNYAVSSSRTFTIEKAASVLTAAPTAVTGLVTDGQAHALVSAGTATGGTLLYKLDGGAYSEAIPTASAAGTYRVYYKVDGGTNYTGKEDANWYVDVTIIQSYGVTVGGETVTSANYTEKLGVAAGGVSYDASTGTLTINANAAPIGNVTILSGTKVVVASGAKLTVSENNTLTVAASASLTNNGTINGDGTVTNNGSFTNSGNVVGSVTVNNNGTLVNNGDIAGSATVSNGSGGTFTNNGYIYGSATLANAGSMTNTGDISLNNTFNNSGTLTNNGKLVSGIVNNTGSLTNNQQGQITCVVNNQANATVTNKGSMTGTVTNWGTITNEAGAITTPAKTTNEVGGTIKTDNGDGTIITQYRSSETFETETTVQASGNQYLIKRIETEGTVQTVLWGVNMDKAMAHGTVSAGKDAAQEGAEVTLTVTPDTGYLLESLTVKDLNGTAVALNGSSFTMPGKAVVVSAAFRLKTFTITWKMDNGSVIDTTTVGYGTVPSHAAPGKAEDSQYTYTFSGWTPGLAPAAADATYTAVFTAHQKPAPAPAPAPTEPPEPADKVEAFVTRCYRVILGREPDAKGLAYWVDSLKSGKEKASEIINGFVTSNEFVNRHYSDETAVEILYKAMLGRSPDEGGKNYWLSVLNGGNPFAAVINGFCTSNEFKNLCANYGIQPGSVEAGPMKPPKPVKDMTKIRAFVTRCYKVILSRDPDPTGLEYWAKALANGDKEAAEIIDGFVNSNEYRAKQLGHADSVEVLYNAMLGRGSDAGGKAYWVSELQAGKPFAVIINGFCTSNEFKDLCNQYGITPGSVKVPDKVKGTFTAATSKTGTERETKQMNEAKLKDFVRRAYVAALGREPGDTEAEHWVWQLRELRIAPAEAARGILTSEEFRSRGIGGEQLIRILYRIYMNRDADEAGLAFWLAKLEAGASPEELMDDFAASAEFKNILHTFWE